MSDVIDCAVIGAGVVGLAVARQMALAGHEVIVLEAANVIGAETSSRNSEVIHAGLYYPTGSLKARLCVEGRRLLYDFCAEHGVAYRRTGKLIVASADSDIQKLEAIHAQALNNGVIDVERLTAGDVFGIEPEISCVGALLSPSTGIVDSHGLMVALRGGLEDRGGVIAFNSPVTGAAVCETGIRLNVGGDEPVQIMCRTLVNAAGLWAQDVARRIAGLNQASIPRQYLSRGRYFTYSGRSPFQRLIYPVPEDGGLGVHVTLDIGGQLRFGPDVEWLDRVDYSFDASVKGAFAQSVRRYFPALDEVRMQPGYTGIRPKLSGPGAAAADFMLQGQETHGVPGLFNLYGIESPGLTASLAIAREVATRLQAGR